MLGKAAMRMFTLLGVAGDPRLSTGHSCQRCGLDNADLLIICVPEYAEIEYYGGCSPCKELFPFPDMIYRPRADSISNLAAKFATRRMVEALVPCIAKPLDLNNLTAKGIIGIIVGFLADSADA